MIDTLLLNHGAEVNFSLLKAFVREEEHDQIDAIIDNPPQEPTELHVRQGANTEILQLEHLSFPYEFQNTVDLIGNEGDLINLQFYPSHLLK